MQAESESSQEMAHALESLTRAPLLSPRFYDVADIVPCAILQERQRELVRQLPRYRWGAQQARKSRGETLGVNEWAIITASEGTVPGEYGPNDLPRVYKGACIVGDCGLCSVCHKPYVDVLSLLIKEGRGKEATDRDAAWMRDSKIEPYFRKDSPSNALTLCMDHRIAYRALIFCLTPSFRDLQALLDFEIENMKRRQQGRCQYRLVPAKFSLSEWYEYLPLNGLAHDLDVGHYRTKIIGDQTAGFRVMYHDNLMTTEIGLPTSYYDAQDQAMMIWLGLSEVSAQVLLRSALKALHAVRHPLPQRHQIVLHKLRELETAYNQPEPSPALKSPRQGGLSPAIASTASELAHAGSSAYEAGDLADNLQAMSSFRASSVADTSTTTDSLFDMPDGAETPSFGTPAAVAASPVPESSVNCPSAAEIATAHALIWEKKLSGSMVTVQADGKEYLAKGVLQLLKTAYEESDLKQRLNTPQTRFRSLAPEEDPASGVSEAMPVSSGAPDPSDWRAHLPRPSASANTTQPAEPPASGASAVGPSRQIDDSMPFNGTQAHASSLLFGWIDIAHEEAQTARDELDAAIALRNGRSKRSSGMMEIENRGVMQVGNSSGGEDGPSGKKHKGKERDTR